MPVRMSKPWQPLTAVGIATVAAHLGVYELADERGEIVYIGVAGGRTLFGLKGELKKAIADPPAGATQYRVEVNMMYHSRHKELLQAFRHDHGRLPVANTDVDERLLGRLRPAGKA